ncbi:MAG: DNA primase, partial [Bifidobacteriaceae bacterium]|nr:DNA primase [Bifidobacteriaceae bacterium]
MGFERNPPGAIVRFRAPPSGGPARAPGAARIVTVPGRIKQEDVERVREAARIDEVAGERVTLKPAGPGSLKGLCPFHDERTPSFHVRPALGVWHCFGCGEGGDTIAFVMKADSLPFKEAVEYLAGRYGIDLHYEAGGPPDGIKTSGRQRLLEANRLAGEYFRAQLDSPEAAAGRQFLEGRGFDRAAADRFGVGYAPKGWDNLLRALRGRNFTDAEIQGAGLVSQGQRGCYDRFRGRLIWPIRDLTGAVIGFGARRLYDDDQGPKYLNTPETAVYHKSQVLYGVDLAKKDISRSREIVIVEGYTDVMAAHLAGVTTAVATCGTAFGQDHIRVVRRLLGDTGDAAAGVITSDGVAHGGRVVFTFDGDAAGQKAAMRAFSEDQRFYAQTFVAVAPDDMDPCELRLARGGQAVKDLVASASPLFKFAIRTVLKSFDLETAEGRVAGMRAAAPIVAGIRDHGLRRDYTRQLAGWIGTDEREAQRAVRAARSGGAGGRRGPAGDDGRSGRSDSGGGGRPRGGDGGSWLAAAGRGGAGGPAVGAVAGAPLPGLPGGGGRGRSRGLLAADPVARVERDALVAALQCPGLVPPEFDQLEADAFTVPA